MAINTVQLLRHLRPAHTRGLVSWTFFRDQYPHECLPLCHVLNLQRVRFFGKIRKRICDPRSYGFFDTKETQNPKKDYFVMTRQAGGTQYICQNDISLVLPKNSTRMEYFINKDSICSSSSELAICVHS